MMARTFAMHELWAKSEQVKKKVFGDLGGFEKEKDS